MEDTVFYERLMGLNPLIGKTATQTQEDEYVWLLYEHGNLDKKFYVDYINNERREDWRNSSCWLVADRII